MEGWLFTIGLVLWCGYIANWTVRNPLPWQRKVIPVGLALLAVLVTVLAVARHRA